MRTLLAQLAILSLVTTTAASAEDFYAGTYTKGSDSKGIYHGEFDAGTGKLGDLHLAAEALNPSFLVSSPDQKFLYAALEDARPAVAAFRIESDGRLAALNQQPSGGADPCHVSLDRTGKFLLVANYSGGSVAVFAIEADGSLGARTAFVEFQGSGPNKGRQAGPHAHAFVTSPDNRFAYACDLGSDKVWIFRFDAKTGALAAADPAFASVPGGAGARHLVFSKDAQFAYVANEMGLNVTAFRRDAETGALEPIQTVAAHTTPPPRGASLAGIELHPDGKWLYISSRGDDTLSTFAVAADGALELVENISAGVKIPRGFAIDPTGRWLLVAGQDDNRIGVFRIDPASGRLVAVDASATVAKPVCILFSR